MNTAPCHYLNAARSDNDNLGELLITYLVK